MKPNIDWQAYLDGTLSREDRLAADLILRASPAARRELDALKHFVRQVAAIGRSEFVPTRRFELLIPARTPNRVLRRAVFAMMPVAVFAGVWYQLSQDPLRLDRTPVVEVVRLNDPLKASTWAASNLGTGIPAVGMKQQGRLCAARRGQGWAAFDYHVGRDRYRLFVSPDVSPLLGRPTIQIASNRFVTSHGVGWQQKGLAFYLTGPSPEMRISLACAASEEIARQTVTPPPSHCFLPPMPSPSKPAPP